MFGFCCAQAGKVHFSYVYGMGALGCVALWALLNLMAGARARYEAAAPGTAGTGGGGISLALTASTLGYCLLPLTALAFVAILMRLTYANALLHCFIPFICVV